jgi:hypothetical protein
VGESCWRCGGEPCSGSIVHVLIIVLMGLVLLTLEATGTFIIEGIR